jgi:hypothetical protein
MLKPLKKKLQPKKSISVKVLKNQLSEEELNSRAASRFAPSITKLKVFEPKCGECGFVPKAGDKIRLIQYGKHEQIICEVCFENRNISDWEFVDRKLMRFLKEIRS